MFVAFLSAVLYATNFSGMLNGEDQGKLLALLVGGGLVCLSGLLGDVGRISSRVEISLVMVPAMLAILAGVMVNFIPLIYLSVPLTLFYLIGGSAAMNLLDGMDGLAPGVTAIAAFFFALLGLQHGQPIVLILSLAVLGSALGFLPYNLGILNSKSQIPNLHGRLRQPVPEFHLDQLGCAAHQQAI
jgi:UDP-GlcNAc:undecaprenyl-phosphate GlcNAc-1-phosphate transferase